MIVTRPLFHTAVLLLALDERDESILGAVRALVARGVVERVVLVHVEERERAWTGGREVGPRPEALDRRVADLADRLAGVEVIGIHAAGRPAEEVARVVEREGADLLVIGRARAEGRLAWGDHGLTLLRTADCPVLIVPDGARPACASAVVGMDLSDNALEALRLALGVCERVRAVAVVDPAAEGESEPEARAGVLRAWEAVRERHADDELPALEVHTSSEPAEALLGLASDADLLVVGSRGLTPLAAVLLGSTAERLGGRCSQPLLVYRVKGEHRGLFGALFRR